LGDRRVATLVRVLEGGRGVDEKKLHERYVRPPDPEDLEKRKRTEEGRVGPQFLKGQKGEKNKRVEEKARAYLEEKGTRFEPRRGGSEKRGGVQQANGLYSNRELWRIILQSGGKGGGWRGKSFLRSDCTFCPPQSNRR